MGEPRGTCKGREKEDLYGEETLLERQKGLVLEAGRGGRERAVGKNPVHVVAYKSSLNLWLWKYLFIEGSPL